MANTTEQNKMLTFLEFIELSESMNKDNPLRDLKRLMSRRKSKKKLGQNNPPESPSVITPEPSLNFGPEKSQLIVFDI